MESYIDNVDGSFIEQRESSVSWNYKNAEEEHGNMVVKELYGQLKVVLENQPVEMIQGIGYLEVKPLKLQKVRFCSLLIVYIVQVAQVAPNRVEFVEWARLVPPNE